MSGLEIHWSESNLDELPGLSWKDTSTFEYIFRPILPRLATYTWLYDQNDGLPFSGLAWCDTEFELEVDKFLRTNGVIPADSLLPRFSHYLKEDWTDLYGFRLPPDAETFIANLKEAENAGPWLKGENVPEQLARHPHLYVEFIRQMGGRMVYRFLAETIDLCFFNVQGVYWEIYSRDVDLIETVRAHVNSNNGLNCVERSLLDRVL